MVFAKVGGVPVSLAGLGEFRLTRIERNAKVPKHELYYTINEQTYTASVMPQCRTCCDRIRLGVSGVIDVARLISDACTIEHVFAIECKAIIQSNMLSQKSAGRPPAGDLST